MTEIFIKETESTPRVLLDHKNGTMEFSGWSLCEDVEQFFNPLFDWIVEYITTCDWLPHLIKFDMQYFNSPTSKLFLSFFESLHDIGDNITIEWCYIKDDIEMYELGKDYESYSNLKFKFTMLESDSI